MTTSADKSTTGSEEEEKKKAGEWVEKRESDAYYCHSGDGIVGSMGKGT